MSFFSVALGGAIGAVGRYAISLIPVKTGFPVQTLITNILGAVLIGFIVGPGGYLTQHRTVLENRGVRRFHHLFHFFSGSIFSVGEPSDLCRDPLYLAERGLLYCRDSVRKTSGHVDGITGHCLQS